MIQILQKGASVLREVAREVSPSDIRTPTIQKVIQKMKEAVTQEEDAVAIAAPQIGEGLRIFVVSGRAVDKDPEEHKNKKNGAKTEETSGKVLRNSASSQRMSADQLADQVFINPEIIKRSRQKSILQEGCLSVRWFYGDVKRNEKVTIRAYDDMGNKVSRGASGLLAQIFQHETDHLNGILFIDTARNLKEIPPEKHAEHDAH